MKYKGWPEPGELVVCKVDEVEDFGAFCDLVEYDDKQGLIHVSEVASGWVKYIRDHVREDQTIVCKVLDIDEDKQQITLSLKDVNDHQTSDKIQEWKNEQKADKWISMAVEDDENSMDVAEKLISKYGTMYDGLEEAAKNGEKVFTDIGIDKSISESLTEVARTNISVPYVTVMGYIDVESRAPDGVDILREALNRIEGFESGEVDIEVEYVSAPEFRITAKAHEYKEAENALKQSAEQALEYLDEVGSSGEYHKKPRKAEA